MGRAAGFARVSLDLIYGTPGETEADWRRSLEAAVAAGPDHLSAYALTVEPGTRLAARVRRGELAPPDDDVSPIAISRRRGADRGRFSWYEISNWDDGRDPVRAQHAVLDGGDWWGVGPGAHSHAGGDPVVERPAPGRLRGPVSAGLGPGRASEILTETSNSSNGSCWRSGWPTGARSGAEPGRAAERGRGGGRGLASPAAYAAGRIV